MASSPNSFPARRIVSQNVPFSQVERYGMRAAGVRLLPNEASCDEIVGMEVGNFRQIEVSWVLRRDPETTLLPMPAPKSATPLRPHSHHGGSACWGLGVVQPLAWSLR